MTARSNDPTPGSAATATTILWLRNDLRLQNHAALAAAASRGQVVPVFIFDPKFSHLGMGRAAAWWLHESLQSLSQAFAARGVQLVLRRGSTLNVLASLRSETGADAIFYSRAYDPQGVALQQSVFDRFGSKALVKRFSGDVLCEPENLATRTGSPYRVFTPFWNALVDRLDHVHLARNPSAIAAVETPIESENLSEWALQPTRPNWAERFKRVWKPGESGASETLETFIAGALQSYADAREIPGVVGTSRLSPYLRIGEISVGQVWNAIRECEAEGSIAAEQGRAYRRELGWREFARHLLFHFPNLVEQNYRSEFDQFPWRTDLAGLSEWQQGCTGYPIVDAGMRELWATGWMHNRVRMVAASFLTKHLRIDWRVGAEWFRDTLVDADIASNTMNWQWVAGCGVDAAPYFRIFNPTLQAKKFDPDSVYINRWVPEISDINAGVYAAPIVDHREARAAALDAYAVVREQRGN